jgi:hypothetical protein
MSVLDDRLGWLADASAWTSGVAAEVASAPWAVAALLVAVGLDTLGLGARARRPLAAVGTGLLAAGAAAALSGPLVAATGLEARTLGGLAALAGAVAGAAVPPAFPALAGALPGALGAAAISPEGQRLLALGLGAAAGAVFGLLLARLVAAAVASAVGALVVALGIAGAIASLGVGRALVAHPAALLGLAAVLAVAGVAWQLPTAWSPAPAPRPRPEGAAGDAEDGAGA